MSHIGQLAGQALELSADAVLIVDQAGDIVYLNQQTEWLFGFAREDLVGQAVEFLLPVDARQSHAALRANFMEAPHPRSMGTSLDLFGQRKDGDVFPIDVSLSPLVLGANRYIVTTIRDLSSMTPLPENIRSRHQVILPFVQTLLNQVPYGVQVLYGPEGRLLLENRYMARLWGVPWPAWQPMGHFLTAIGTTIEGIEGNPLPPEKRAALTAAHQADTIGPSHEVICQANGTRVSVLVQTVPVDPSLLDIQELIDSLNQSQRLPGLPHPDEVPMHERQRQDRAQASVLVAIYQDITSPQAAERIKDEFFALVSHELRTPLAILRGYAETFAARGLPEVLVTVASANEQDSEVQEWIAWQREARDTILQATDQLTQLFDDLLEVASVQARALTLRREPLDLVALAHLATSRASSAPSTNAAVSLPQVRVVCKCEHAVVLTDRHRLERVLIHLLNNAINFSPAGGIVTVTLRRDRAAGTAALSVRDQGIGIPADQQDQVFGRFVRAENAQRSGIPGRTVWDSISAERLSRCMVDNSGLIRLKAKAPLSR